MKKQIFIAFIAFMLLLPSVTRAQDQGTTSAADVISIMIRLLKLNNEQVREVTPLVTQYMIQEKAITAKYLSPDDQKRQIKEALDDLDSQLGHYLSKEQIEQWNAVMAQAQQKQLNVSPSTSSSEHKESVSHEETPPKDEGVLQSSHSSANGGGVY